MDDTKETFNAAEIAYRIRREREDAFEVIAQQARNAKKNRAVAKLLVALLAYCLGYPQPDFELPTFPKLRKLLDDIEPIVRNRERLLSGEEDDLA